MINPIIIHQPEKVVERTYTEGYRERIVERPGGQTEPLPVFVLPPMEQAQPQPSIIVVASPTQPGERTYEPTRSPGSDTQTERTPDKHSGVEAPTPETPALSRQPAHIPEPPVVPIVPNKNSSPERRETIPINSGNNSPTELIEPDKPAPQASLPGYKKKGKIGRQRKYEELGNDDIEPVKEVVLFRYQMGRHWPGLSKDMEAYYERLYFTRPKKGSKDYDKHKGCWDRKQRWINPTATS